VYRVCCRESEYFPAKADSRRPRMRLRLETAVPPAGGDLGGQDAVAGLRQRRVPVLGEAPELRAGGVHDHQVLQSRDDLDALCVVGDLGGTGLLAGADEGVLRRLPPGLRDAVPGVLLDTDPGRGDRLLGAGEVPGEPEAELLGGRDATFLGEGEHGVLHRVGRQHVGVVAAVVDVVHGAGQRDGDAEVLDVVDAALTGDPDDAGLRLAVLVLAEKRGHGRA
jgi:hypothetical protein